MSLFNATSFVRSWEQWLFVVVVRGCKTWSLQSASFGRHKGAVHRLDRCYKRDTWHPSYVRSYSCVLVFITFYCFPLVKCTVGFINLCFITNLLITIPAFLYSILIDEWVCILEGYQAVSVSNNPIIAKCMRIWGGRSWHLSESGFVIASISVVVLIFFVLLYECFIALFSFLAGLATIMFYISFLCCC